MRRILLLVVALGFCFSSGCGSGDPGVAPAIKSLTHNPTAVTAGKAVTVSGSFVFEDPDADGTQFVIKIATPNGQTQQLPPAAAAGTSGLKAGTIMFAFMLNPMLAGDYALELWMLDDAGNRSNSLKSTISAK